MSALYRQNAKQVLCVDNHVCDAVSVEVAALIVKALNASSTPLRYDLIRIGNGYRYGDWRINPADWNRPSPLVDWDWVHDDYDGAEDAGDHRCGAAASAFDCILEIHNWEDEQ